MATTVRVVNGGCDEDAVRAIMSWCQEHLAFTGDLRVTVQAKSRHTCSGRARFLTLPAGGGAERRLTLNIAVDMTPVGGWPWHHLDPRVEPIHDWIKSHPPFQNVVECMIWLAGHELWHTIDPFSCERRVSRSKDYADFCTMEQRCDAAGFKLVDEWRREPDALRARIERYRARSEERERELSAVQQRAAESAGTTRGLAYWNALRAQIK